MKLVLSSFIAVALLGWGSAALAADQVAQSRTIATLVCRPAASGETASATTSDKVALVCKPLDMKPIMAMKPKIEALPNGEKMWGNLMNDFTLKGGP